MVERISMIYDAVDRKAANLENLLKRANFIDLADLKEAVRAAGFRTTTVAGIQYVIKNNSQRERLVQDHSAMAFWMETVVGKPPATVLELKIACRNAGVSWTAVKRIALEMGYYVVNGSVVFVGYEMDNDTRIQVMRGIREAVSSGIDIDSELVWGVVSARWEVDPESFERCREVVKANLDRQEVE
jgi:hypothetical protein